MVPEKNNTNIKISAILTKGSDIMPELPEVETVRKTLLTKLKNRKILSMDVYYDNIFEKENLAKTKKNIKNQTINDIKRRGKWLIFELDDYDLLSHLRMEGKYLYRTKNDVIKKHEHVVFNLDNNIQLRYQDVRKFGKMHLVKKEDLKTCEYLKDLGYEPWDKNLNPAYLKEKYKNRSHPIKTVLLDQSIIVGIGNIYADEILFLSKINPWEKAKNLNETQLENIIKNTKIVLDKAIKEGGTTIRSYTSSEGVTGRFQNDLNVHKRENEKCRICQTIIVRDKIGGRSSYYCPKCQKLNN